MALLAGMAGVLVARDLEGATASLRCEAEQLAAGQPEAAPVEVGDDDLARLSGAMRVLGASLREALASREQAATRVEDQVARLSVALAGIAEASSVQQAEIDRVDLLMGSVQSQLDEASRSALELVTAMDASGHSVDQLGATGVELNETASLLTSRVDAVSASLEQMVESVRQVGSTTERLAEASDETSSSMEEMASAMRAVDTAAETTAKLSRDVVARAELGQAKVVQTIAGMEDIREATEAAERVIRGLGARTSEIGGILDVIEDVADETNLLALNAAIIAAQAGEQGKAFSVVAEEIKELADRVLASTKEIGGLISAVQQESENAIGAIEAGSNRVMDGVDLAAEAGRTLEEITAASRESGDRIGEIVGAVREQTKAASHVVALMERVRESADRIGEATAEQDRGNDVVHRSAQTMREVAEQVRRTTEAQSAGFERIRANVADVRGSADRITRFLQDQAEACTQVTGFLASVAEGSRSSERCVDEVCGAMDGLRAEARRLRAEVEGFGSRVE
jgi:methyl-accepting chemotaxis protein